MNLEQLEARLARIEARLEALETIEARALSDTEPPPAAERRADGRGRGVVLQEASPRGRSVTSGAVLVALVAALVAALVLVAWLLGFPPRPR